MIATKAGIIIKKSTYCYNNSELFLFHDIYTFRHQVVANNINETSCWTILSCQDDVDILGVHGGKPLYKSLYTSMEISICKSKESNKSKRSFQICFDHD